MTGNRHLLGVLATALLAAGCEKVPDHCLDYELACLNVTIDSGPPEVRRLRVDVLVGIETSTVPTPKKPPKGPLVYPLRFAIKFARFDNVFGGEITFDTFAMNDDFDVIGQAKTLVQINGVEKKSVHISLEAPPPPPPPDLSADPPDMSTPMPDMATPGQSTDMATDLSTTPDMP
jgi:hypothetical protein